jgi:hypothetical protein
VTALIVLLLLPVNIAAPDGTHGSRIAIEEPAPRDRVPISGTVRAPLQVGPGGGLTYVSDDGVLGRLSAAGRLRWSLLLGPTQSGPAAGAGGTLWVASDDGHLYGVNPHGHLVFALPLSGLPQGTPAVGDDFVAVAVAEHQLEFWSLTGDRLAEITLPARPAGPAVLIDGPRVAVPLEDGTVACATTSGLLWRRALPGAGTMGPLAVSARHDILAVRGDGSLGAVTPTGELRWSRAVGIASDRPPVIDDEYVYVIGGHDIAALAPATGVVDWLVHEPASVVAAACGRARLYVATRDAEGRGQLVILRRGGIEAQVTLPAAPLRALSIRDGQLWLGLAGRQMYKVTLGAAQ